MEHETAPGTPAGAKYDYLYWDGMEKLRKRTTVRTDTGALETYTAAYDGAGDRVTSTLGGITTTYTYGAGLLQTTGSDGSSTLFTPGVSQRKNGVDSFFHDDWMGSTRHLTDGTGMTAMASYRFDGYGVQSAGTAPGGTLLRFAGGHGYEDDGPAGSQLLGARYYDPTLGRFLSPDPIGHVGGLNLYGYCGNDPVNKVDPSGLIDDESIVRITEISFGAIGHFGGTYFGFQIGGSLGGLLGGGGGFLGGSVVPGAGNVAGGLGGLSVGAIGGGILGGAGGYVVGGEIGRAGGRQLGQAIVATKGWILSMMAGNGSKKGVGNSGSGGGNGGSGGSGCGKPPSNRAPVRAAGLPKTGKLRYIPPKSWENTKPLPRDPKSGGYFDKFGNVWRKGPPHHFPEDPFEWDVQLPGGGHWNVSRRGIRR